jgi:hypothetical protein
MMMLKRSLSSREQILINVLKALASIISMCSPYVIFDPRLHPNILHLQKRPLVHLTHLFITAFSCPFSKVFEGSKIYNVTELL